MVGRVLVGAYFILSGIKHFTGLAGMTGYAKSKGMMMPRESVIITGLMMLVGGLGVLLWVRVEMSLWLLIAFLVLSSFLMHRYWSVSEPMARMGEEINFKKNLALAGALLMVLAMM